MANEVFDFFFLNFIIDFWPFSKYTTHKNEMKKNKIM